MEESGYFLWNKSEWIKINGENFLYLETSRQIVKIKWVVFKQILPPWCQEKDFYAFINKSRAHIHNLKAVRVFGRQP